MTSDSVKLQLQHPRKDFLLQNVLFYMAFDSLEYKQSNHQK
jgi:hypothetical protein